MREHEREIEFFRKDGCEYSGWTKKSFTDLNDGDIFRIFDAGERYFNSETGDNIWIAVGEPYLKNNIWTINTLY
jgi:hypothetical protein